MRRVILFSVLLLTAVLAASFTCPYLKEQQELANRKNEVNIYSVTITTMNYNKSPIVIQGHGAETTGTAATVLEGIVRSAINKQRIYV